MLDFHPDEAYSSLSSFQFLRLLSRFLFFSPDVMAIDLEPIHGIESRPFRGEPPGAAFLVVSMLVYHLFGFIAGCK